MKVMFSKFSLLLIAAVLLLSGCGAAGSTNGANTVGAQADSGSAASSEPSVSPAAGETEAKKLQVVTTFYPMYEFSKQVGGEYADVTALIPAGTEPHDWEPSAKDMAVLKEADVFVYNGIVEGWAEQALDSAANEKRIVVEASSSIELAEGGEDEHAHGEEAHSDADAEHDHAAEHEEAEHEEAEHEEAGHEHDHEHSLDPHVWLSPKLAQAEVAAIQEAFAKADPAHADSYKANADAYIAKLKELDDAYKAGLAGMKRTEFVTQHAAFGYLAREYGLTQVPISGLSPDQEPSPEQMAEIVKLAKEQQIKTIFFETLVDPKIASTIASEIGAKTAVLNPLEGLTEEETADGLDYIGVMKNNLEALRLALNE
ncbi:zinc transport system substrate-binding protein [Paenibacillus algorifonticola]|uniref:Zinc transport system substrate-binding protein n=1 Tax=Paenibacillus algorifonticola TaxID=684063 RepID=A0A1I2J0T2_9BACL|nr:metal ABC transporter substrate-binding protein [Paenibacillus algorifonticola]SFF48084.1 zinc transport system substrate-binding protein [Paenibacillus algorifonticola]